MAQRTAKSSASRWCSSPALFGVPPYANLTVVETENGAPNGYAAPGLIFLNPRAIGKSVNSKLLSNQISRQWCEVLVSPVTRNHLWLTNGFSTYSEMLWAEHTAGAGALETQFQNVSVEALTVDNVPVMQAARLEDYSPELWALTGSKGAAVLDMLRFVIGDEKFFADAQGVHPAQRLESGHHRRFQKGRRRTSPRRICGYFFIQWIESSGAPEFKLEYTIFRTQKGFRVMGKIAQDLDTFRMPVDLKIETEGNPEEKRVEVVGTSSEFSVDTFGKPKTILIDPNNRVLRYSNQMRVAVAIRRGEQFAGISEYGDALKEYPEGAGIEPQQLAGAFPDRARFSSCRTIIRRRRMNSASRSMAIWSRSGPKSGRTSAWARFSTSPASASAR